MDTHNSILNLTKVIEIDGQSYINEKERNEVYTQARHHRLHRRQITLIHVTAKIVRVLS